MELQDVTLREGEQRSNQSYSVDQKVLAARELDELGVDAIQVGFPIADDGTQAVCERLDLDAETVALARLLERDIDAAADSGVDSVVISAPTSDKLRERILGIDREELTNRIQTMIDYARRMELNVTLGAMDGFRTDPAFINDLFEATDTPFFSLADTVGARTPNEVSSFLDEIDGDLSRISVHFHRDLGVGTANALAAADSGVGRVDVTVGGIGERVGNVAFEEVVVAGELGTGEFETSVDTGKLIPTCRSVLDCLDEPIPAEKPIIGETAFEHESGMHTAVMLDDPSTFEAFDPADFGGTRSLLFGPSSGNGAARQLLERVGADPSDRDVAEFLGELHALDSHVSFERALELADQSASEAGS